MRNLALLLPSCLLLWACPAPDVVHMIPKASDGSPGAILASGSDPAWQLRIDRKNWEFASEELGERRSGKTPPGEKLPSGGSRYATEDITIEFLPGPCSDDVTGQRFFDSARVVIEGAKLEGCGGPLLPPADLNRTSWTGQKQLPEYRDMIRREFGGTMNFADGTVSGSTGCNRFNASYRVEDDLLHVGPLAMTKMLCEGLPAKFEDRFVKLLSNPARISFTRDGTLILSREWDLSLSFDRAD